MEDEAAVRQATEWFIEGLRECDDLAERASWTKPNVMSDELWARCVLGLTDESLLQEQPEWVLGVEGLDAALWPTYWDELEGATAPDWRKKPNARLIRTSRDAEEVAAAWLQYFAFPDATPTGLGADGGVDVEGTGVVAQVKAEAKPTARPVIQQTYGIAASRRATAVVFSLAGYTPEAVQWAEDAGMALFQFDLQGEPESASSGADRLMDEAERAVRRQGSGEPVEIGPFGSERVKSALSRMVIKAMDSVQESLNNYWLWEETGFDEIDRPWPHDESDRNARIDDWRRTRHLLRSVAWNVIAVARLMEELDLPSHLDPVLPRLLFILFEPDLHWVSFHSTPEETVARWIEVRAAYGPDRAERFTETIAKAKPGAFAQYETQSEIEAFVRRVSNILGDTTA